jgi:hypothetical protein
LSISKSARRFESADDAVAHLRTGKRVLGAIELIGSRQ